jgi:hypothetical protein
MRRRRYATFLPNLVARSLSRLLKPPSGVDALASEAIRSLGGHTDQTHAAVLALLDEMVAIGGRERADVGCEAPAELVQVG